LRDGNAMYDASRPGAAHGLILRAAVALGPGLSSFCARLRAATQDEHAAVERQIRLPDGIATLEMYRDLLRGFLAVHRPLGRAILALPGWEITGIDPRERVRIADLEADLRALGADPACLHRPEEHVRPGGSIAGALGTLYVLEGSTLGGLVIARALRERFGDAIVGAMAFLAGRGPQTVPMWRRFKTALDAYGLAFPEQADAMIAGARATFAAHCRQLPTMPSGLLS
jgi:heme oxygenase (biliverdin-IX-beta and delta-forming)